MPNNIDLIEIVSTAGENEGCQCTASDFAGDFIAKNGGLYDTSLGATGGASVWTPYTFTLGTGTNTGAGNIATMTVQGDTNNDAVLSVKGGATCTIKPNQITCAEFKSGNNNIRINNTSCSLVGTAFSGDITPDTDSSRTIGSNAKRFVNVYSDDLNVSGTATIGTLSLTSLTLSGNLTVSGTTALNGNITLGDADSDSVTVNGAVTFNDAFTVPNASGTINTGNNLIQTAGRIACTGTAASSFNKLTVSDALIASQAPAADTEVVRRTDVNVGTSVNLSSAVHKTTVVGGYITAIAAASGADVPTHSNRHDTTTLTSNTPAAAGDDGLHSYEVGAVTRTDPVVGKPLKLINNASSSDYRYTGGAAEDYFVLIESDAGEPASTGLPGQIIFRKAN